MCKKLTVAIIYMEGKRVRENDGNLKMTGGHLFGISLKTIGSKIF